MASNACPSTQRRVSGIWLRECLILVFEALFSAKEDKGRKGAGIVLMLSLIGALGSIFLVSALNNPKFGTSQTPPIDFVAIGKQMVTYYGPALIVLALTLAGSVIGALALARREDIEQRNE